MEAKTVIFLLLLQLLASHIFYYRKLVIEDLEWEETISLGGTNVTFSRDSNTALLRSSVEHFDILTHARAIGYAHAKDRLSQMNQQRWVARGRLSECFAATEELKAIDGVMKELGFVYHANEFIRNKISKENLAYLQAYADGVNDFFRLRQSAIDSTRYFHYFIGGWLQNIIPIESTLIDKCGLTKWEPVDSLAIVSLMSYLGLAEVQIAAEKLFLEALIADVPAYALKQIFPHFSDFSEDLIAIYKSIHLSKSFVPKHIPFLSSFPKFLASNNWVVGPEKSETGHAIQCNDPHLDTSRLPAIWYEYIHQSTSDSRSWYGITVPGFPAFIMGRTKYISYGLTYGFMDTLDFFVEEVKGGKYRDGDEYKDFFVRKEKITSLDGSVTHLVFLHSQDHLRSLELDSHLASDILSPDGKIKIKDGRYLSSSFSFNLMENENIKPFYPLEATTVMEAQLILRYSPVSANYLIADTQGNIGYQQSGLLPARSNSGLFPALAWLNGSSWSHPVPVDQLHRLLNPPEGFIVTANDEWQNPEGPPAVTLHMGPYRADRASFLISSKAKVNRDDMVRIQADNYSPQAARYFAVIKPLLSHPSIDQRVRDELQAWDFNYLAASKAPVIFDEFLKALFKDVYGKLFGPEVIAQLFISRISILTVFMGIFDDVILQTPHDELWFGPDGRDGAFLRALSSLTYPKEEYGFSHAISHRNTYFKDSLSYLLGFSKHPRPIDGGKQTLNAAARFTPEGYPESWFCPSWRYIADMGNDFVETQLPGGVSSRRFSGIYDNHLEDYYSFVYKPTPLFSPQQ